MHGNYHFFQEFSRVLEKISKFQEFSRISRSSGNYVIYLVQVPYKRRHIIRALNVGYTYGSFYLTQTVIR